MNWRFFKTILDLSLFDFKIKNIGHFGKAAAAAALYFLFKS